MQHQMMSVLVHRHNSLDQHRHFCKLSSATVWRGPPAASGMPHPLGTKVLVVLAVLALSLCSRKVARGQVLVQQCVHLRPQRLNRGQPTVPAGVKALRSMLGAQHGACWACQAGNRTR